MYYEVSFGMITQDTQRVFTKTPKKAAESFIAKWDRQHGWALSRRRATVEVAVCGTGKPVHFLVDCRSDYKAEEI